MATHSSILAWETHGQRSLGLQATVGAVTARGGAKSRMRLSMNTCLHVSNITKQ